MTHRASRGAVTGPCAPAFVPVGAAAGDGCLRPGGRELTHRLVEVAGLCAGAAVLDVGCGAGATVAYLAGSCGMRATGLDASDAQLARARAASPGLRFVAGRAEALPFATDTFDGVLCECVLSTLPEPGPAVAEMARVLTPHGALVISDLYVREGAEATPPGALPSLGRRERILDLLAAAGLAAETWGDQTGELARYLWELAGRRAATPAPRRGDGPGGRRLGYFFVVARADPRGRVARERLPRDCGVT